MSDPIDELFDSVIKAHVPNKQKENTDDTLDASSLWGYDRSSSSPAVPSGTLDFDFQPDAFKTPGEALTLSPVENFAFDFGFEPTFDKNVELDEEQKPFQTYSERRTFRADVISFCERYYFEHSELPKYALLHETFKDYPEAPRYIKNWKQLLEELKNDEGLSIQDQLEFRGLPTYMTGDDYLEPQFVSATHLILNPHDKRSDAAKLKDVGVSSAKWNAWLKRRPYRKYYHQHAEKIFDEETQVEAKRALDALVRKQDLSAIKYVDERTGVYRGQTQNLEIVGMFMQAIFSILARNVPSNIINIIQAEIREEPVMKQLLADSVEIQEAKAS